MLIFILEKKMPPAKKGCAASHLIARVALEEKRQIYEIGARISAKEMQFQVQYRTMQQTKNQISFDHVCLSCCQPRERERERGKERKRQTHHFYRCPQNKTRDRDRRLTKRIKRFGEIHLFFSLSPQRYQWGSFQRWMMRCWFHVIQF